jgi:hypothetical protein
LVNLAPLLAVTLGLPSPVAGVPAEWSGALTASQLDEGEMIDYVRSDPTLMSMISTPLNPEALNFGQIGLLVGPELLGDWDEPGDEGILPERGWWPEAIQLGDAMRLAYPADQQPEPVLAFFAPVAHPELGVVDLARLLFPLVGNLRPRGNRPSPLIDWPTSDGRCAHQIGYETGFREVTCRTLNCEHGCVRRVVPRDGGRKAVFCECP